MFFSVVSAHVFRSRRRSFLRSIADARVRKNLVKHWQGRQKSRFGANQASHARLPRQAKNRSKSYRTTNKKSISNLLANDQEKRCIFVAKTFENRGASVWRGVRRLKPALRISRELSRSIFERSWRGPRRAFGGPASQERSWHGLGVLLAVPGASRRRPGASPNRPEAPRTVQDRFWNVFGLIFRPFLVDFASFGTQYCIVLRFSGAGPSDPFLRRFHYR